VSKNLAGSRFILKSRVELLAPTVIPAAKPHHENRNARRDENQSRYREHLLGEGRRESERERQAERGEGAGEDQEVRTELQGLGL
jgi:hypothetical protein